VLDDFVNTLEGNVQSGRLIESLCSDRIMVYVRARFCSFNAETLTHDQTQASYRDRYTLVPQARCRGGQTHRNNHRRRGCPLTHSPKQPSAQSEGPSKKEKHPSATGSPTWLFGPLPLQDYCRSVERGISKYEVLSLAAPADRGDMLSP